MFHVLRNIAVLLASMSRSHDHLAMDLMDVAYLLRDSEPAFSLPNYAHSSDTSATNVGFFVPPVMESTVIVKVMRATVVNIAIYIWSQDKRLSNKLWKIANKLVDDIALPTAPKSTASTADVGYFRPPVTKSAATSRVMGQTLANIGLCTWARSKGLGWQLWGAGERLAGTVLFPAITSTPVVASPALIDPAASKRLVVIAERLRAQNRTAAEELITIAEVFDPVTGLTSPSQSPEKLAQVPPYTPTIDHLQTWAACREVGHRLALIVGQVGFHNHAAADELTTLVMALNSVSRPPCSLKSSEVLAQSLYHRLVFSWPHRLRTPGVKARLCVARLREHIYAYETPSRWTMNTLRVIGAIAKGK